MKSILSALAIVLAIAGCSKKTDTPAPAKDKPAATAPATPAAPSASCGDCAKYDACCAALVAIPDSGVDKTRCDERGKTCNSLGAEMQGDMNATCAERVAEWRKAKPDVAACK